MLLLGGWGLCPILPFGGEQPRGGCDLAVDSLHPLASILVLFLVLGISFQVAATFALWDNFKGVPTLHQRVPFAQVRLQDGRFLVFVGTPRVSFVGMPRVC